MGLGQVKHATRQIAKRAYYYGMRYHCPICGASTRSRKTYSHDIPVLKQLDVIGGEYVENDDCPICFANQRSRLVYIYLTRMLKPPAGTRVLHVAPERALYEHLFSRLPLDYHPVDMVPDRYDYIAGIVAGDITNLAYPDGRFDLVLCNHVLEHVPDDRLAMRELRRVLAPGGRAILQVPLSPVLPATIEDPAISDPKEQERRFGQFDHVRIYAFNDYVARLRDSGFTVDLLPAADIADAATVRAFGLNPREKLVIGRG